MGGKLPSWNSGVERLHEAKERYWQKASRAVVGDERIRIAEPVVPGKWRRYWLSFTELGTLYADLGSLKAVASELNLSSKTTRRILDASGVDYLKDFDYQHRAGESWSAIARRNGIKLHVLTRLQRARGVVIPKGNHARPIDHDDLVEAYRNLGSVAGVARKFDLDWKTAKKKLVAAGLLS